MERHNPTDINAKNEERRRRTRRRTANTVGVNILTFVFLSFSKLEITTIPCKSLCLKLNSVYFEFSRAVESRRQLTLKLVE